MAEIFWVTGEINSGKTTGLQNRVSGRNDVYGILTPKVEGKRIFQDIKTGEHWRMESEGEEESLQVGRYSFSLSGFQKANDVLLNALHLEGKRWIILDEIGPLELNGLGFSSFLQNATKKCENDLNLGLVMVVRTQLVDSVVEKFGIPFRSFPESKQN
jgi:nucleoside-triphosphatase THEP1